MGCSLCSSLGGVDPEKLYRATLTWGWWIGLVSPHLSAFCRQKSGRRSSILGTKCLPSLICFLAINTASIVISVYYSKVMQSRLRLQRGFTSSDAATLRLVAGVTCVERTLIFPNLIVNTLLLKFLVYWLKLSFGFFWLLPDSFHSLCVDHSCIVRVSYFSFFPNKQECCCDCFFACFY